MTGGTASLIRTQLAVRHRDPTDKQAPSKKRIFEEPPPVELSDDDGDNSNDDDDDNTAEATGEGGSAGANVNGKRQRRAPNRMEPAAVPKKRKPAAVKAKGPAGAAKDDPTLNERTRQPYVRGPYAKEKTPKDGEKKVDRKAPGPHVDKNLLGESLTASKLQAAEINSLKMQLTFAKEQHETLKSNQAALISAAKLEMSAGHATALLEQYKLGVKDGAHISSGKVWTLGGTPSSVGTPQ